MHLVEEGLPEHGGFGDHTYSANWVYLIPPPLNENLCSMEMPHLFQYEFPKESKVSLA